MSVVRRILNTELLSMTSTASLSPVANTASRKRIHSSTLLLVCTAKEKEIFFSSPDARSFVEQCPWFDTHKSNATTDWSAAIHSLRPEVIVSCWSTPRLPDDATDYGIKYVCHTTGAVRYVVPRAFLERGGIVTNWGGLAAPQVAEHALLLALAALRNQPRWRGVAAALQAGSPHPVIQVETRTLMGRRVGLHGFGHIARELVRLLQPFGVHIAAYSKGVPPHLMRERGVVACQSLGEAMTGAEVFFECEALTVDSIGSVGAAQLGLLPDGAVFVNVGRGGVLDEGVLFQEAANGRLRVAVDVTSSDRSIADSPLLKLPQVIVSPHIGGPTQDRFAAFGEQALRNLEHYRQGEPLEALVTLEIYDRST